LCCLCSSHCQLLEGANSPNRKLFGVIADKPQSDISPPPPIRGRMQNAHDASQISAEKQLEMRLRDFLLDIEDRIYQGTLGAIKVFVNCKAPRSTVVPSSL